MKKKGIVDRLRCGTVCVVVFASTGCGITAFVPNRHDAFVSGLRISPIVESAHRGVITSVSFSDNGRMLTAGADGGCRVWDLHNRRQLAEFIDTLQGVCTAAISHDGSFAVSAGKWKARDAGVQCLLAWDAASGKILWSFRDHGSLGGSIEEVAISPDSDRIAAAGHFGMSFEVHLWDRQGTELAVIGDKRYRHFRSLPDESLMAFFTPPIRFSPDGTRLLIGSSYENCAYLADAKTGNIETCIRLPEDIREWQLCGGEFSPDGRYIAFAVPCIGGDVSTSQIRFWDVAGDIWSHSVTNQGCVDYCSIRFSPNGDFVAYHVGTSEEAFLSRIGIVRMNERPLRVAHVDESEDCELPFYVEFSPDGRHLATHPAWQDVTRFWEVGTWNLVRSLRCPGSADFPFWELEGWWGSRTHFSMLYFSPDGRYFARTYPRRVCVWRVQDILTPEGLLISE